MANDDLSLIVGGKTIGGWTSVNVTRGIERLPSEFSISMTEYYPQDTTTTTVFPNDPCVVKIGSDVAITGYIDRFNPSITRDSHTISVSGRGKCADFVDCSAEWPSSQISNVSALTLAQKLSAPYGIKVTGDAASNTIIPQYNLLYGETAYDVLEKACRYLKLLAYDGTDGNLILSRVGSGQMSSALVEGKNVQSASAVFSMDQRYSEYVVRLLSMATMTDLGDAGDALWTTKDKGVNRHRRRYIVAENGQAILVDGEPLGAARGKWDAARRIGRSQVLTVTVDSWRDGAGKLWEPNYLVPLELPSLKITKKKWIIGEVTYIRDMDGERAQIIAMPPDAFSPEPELLQPFVGADIRNDAGGSQ